MGGIIIETGDSFSSADDGVFQVHKLTARETGDCIFDENPVSKSSPSHL
jgi:hypothetical protein